MPAHRRFCFQVTFDIELKMDDIPLDSAQLNAEHEFKIKPVGFHEELVAKLRYLGSCDCEAQAVSMLIRNFAIFVIVRRKGFSFLRKERLMTVEPLMKLTMMHIDDDNKLTANHKCNEETITI